MFKARSAFIAVLVCGAFAGYAIPAAATTIEAAPATDLSGGSLNCPWGYASAADDGVVSHGETVVTPSETDTVLDSFSFYVTQLRDADGQPVGEPRTITYKAYVGAWDGQTVTETVWQSVPRTLTTSDAAQEITVETGGVPLNHGQQYALFFSTHETNEFNTLEDRGCTVNAVGNPYAAGASLIRYLSDTDWRVGLFSADVAFKATFSAPAPQTVYAFDGFYQPVENRDAAGTLILNRVQAGSAVPLKFRLGGDFGLDVFAEGYPKSQAIGCDSDAEVNGVDETVNAGQSSLQYDATTGIYTYVWKTEKAWEDTCRQLVVKFDDGTTARANFTLK